MFAGFQVWYARVRIKKAQLWWAELGAKRGERVGLAPSPPERILRLKRLQCRGDAGKQVAVGPGAVAAGGAVCR